MKDQIQYYEDKLAYEMDSADLFSSLNQGENVVVVDTRSKEVYEKEHIPDSISFPHRDMNNETVKVLDKTKVYVCYCDGIGCNGSTKGALNLVKLGFQVKELIGGLDWWKRDGYATDGKKSVSDSSISCGC